MQPLFDPFAKARNPNIEIRNNFEGSNRKNSKHGNSKTGNIVSDFKLRIFV